jgi:hypothetical protein
MRKREPEPELSLTHVRVVADRELDMISGGTGNRPLPPSPMLKIKLTETGISG